MYPPHPHTPPVMHHPPTYPTTDLPQPSSYPLTPPVTEPSVTLLSMSPITPTWASPSPPRSSSQIQPDLASECVQLALQLQEADARRCDVS